VRFRAEAEGERVFAIYPKGNNQVRLTHFLAAAAALGWPAFASAGPFAPAAGQVGSTAVDKNSPLIKAWASGFQNLIRGPQDVNVAGSPAASFGTGDQALGVADADISSANVVSLGDGGSITLTFDKPIANGPGADFAVYENGFAVGVNNDYLELAFVDVSSDGKNFVRFSAVSLTPTTAQVGSFATLDPTNINNLAGKYVAGFGTPFDLSDLQNPPASLDLNHINYVRITDVIGNVGAGAQSLDSLGNPINDPYPTAFPSGGFDLDAVAVMNQSDVPEPGGIALLAAGASLLYGRPRVCLGSR
jgi:hypothetical protein